MSDQAQRVLAFSGTLASLFALYTLFDVWIITRRENQGPRGAAAVAILAAALLATFVMFGRCACTGVCPQPPAEARA